DPRADGAARREVAREDRRRRRRAAAARFLGRRGVHERPTARSAGALGHGRRRGETALAALGRAAAGAQIALVARAAVRVRRALRRRAARGIDQVLLGALTRAGAIELHALTGLERRG